MCVNSVQRTKKPKHTLAEQHLTNIYHKQNAFEYISKTAQKHDIFKTLSFSLERGLFQSPFCCSNTLCNPLKIQRNHRHHIVVANALRATHRRDPSLSRCWLVGRTPHEPNYFRINRKCHFAERFAPPWLINHNSTRVVVFFSFFAVSVLVPGCNLFLCFVSECSVGRNVRTGVWMACLHAAERRPLFVGVKWICICYTI